VYLIPHSGSTNSGNEKQWTSKCVSLPWLYAWLFWLSLEKEEMVDIIGLVIGSACFKLAVVTLVPIYKRNIAQWNGKDYNNLIANKAIGYFKARLIIWNKKIYIKDHKRKWTSIILLISLFKHVNCPTNVISAFDKPCIPLKTSMKSLFMSRNGHDKNMTTMYRNGLMFWVKEWTFKPRHEKVTRR
jgi:hypothetical protein